MKKFFAVLMTMALVLSMFNVAFAADVEQQTGTITVKNVTEETELELYRVVEYTFNAEEGNYNTADIVDAYKAAFVTAINANNGDDADFTADTADQDLLLYITNNLQDDSAFAEALALELEAVAADVSYTTEDGAYADNALTFTVNSGYYFIKDVTEAAVVEGGRYESIVMLQPSEDAVEITLKSDVYTPPVKVIVGDEDDNTQGSYSIGDVIEFQAAFTVPNLGYEEFVYYVTDVMSAGLTLNEDTVAVAVNEETVETPENVNEEGEAFRYAFDQTAVQPGDVIVITYSATLNENAVTGENGLSTNSLLDYSDKTEGQLVGEPPVVEINTYGIDVYKHNEVNEALAGVTFKLARVNGETVEWLTFEDGKFAGIAENEDLATVLTTDEAGKITVLGLALGNYQLKEVETLDGYNLLAEPVEVVIDGLNAENEDVVLEPVDVENRSGIELPSTGGMGTGVFSVVGMTIMAGAVVLFVINRKRLFA